MLCRGLAGSVNRSTNFTEICPENIEFVSYYQVKEIRKEVNEMLTIVNCVLATACLVRALTRD